MTFWLCSSLKEKLVDFGEDGLDKQRLLEDFVLFSSSGSGFVNARMGWCNDEVLAQYYYLPRFSEVKYPSYVFFIFRNADNFLTYWISVSEVNIVCKCCFFSYALLQCQPVLFRKLSEIPGFFIRCADSPSSGWQPFTLLENANNRIHQRKSLIC